MPYVLEINLLMDPLRAMSVKPSLEVYSCSREAAFTTFIQFHDLILLASESSLGQWVIRLTIATLPTIVHSDFVVTVRTWKLHYSQFGASRTHSAP